MRTEFNIAHIQIIVETPYDLQVTGGYELYLMNSQKEKLPKFFYGIQMEEDSAFPKKKGRILFQDELNLYLEAEDGAILHFFRIPFTRSAAAWCETVDQHSLKIHYRPEARDYFRRAVYCFNAAAFESILHTFDKFLFHCSYVDVGGEAVLFSAHSGGGKTTHALLWEKCGAGEMINGDRAVIEKTNKQKAEIKERGGRDRIFKSGYMVHGLPIAGSSNVFKNRSLPLRAIFMLEKAPVNEVIEMPPAKRFLQAIEQVTMHTWDREFVSDATNFVADMVQDVPVKLLRCRPDEGAVEAVRKSLIT